MGITCDNYIRLTVYFFGVIFTLVVLLSLFRMDFDEFWMGRMSLFFVDGRFKNIRFARVYAVVFKL